MHGVRLDNNADIGALVFDSCDVGIVTIDHEGQVVRCNPAALTILGSPGEATTRLFNVCQLPTMPDDVRRGIREALDSGRHFSAEFEYISMHGKHSFLKLDARPVAVSENRNGAILQLLDISNARAAQEQLRKTSKMESLSLLAGSLAHDLNNVFTALVGYSSLVRKPGGLPPSRQTHALEMIEKAAFSGAKLVENLLGFTSERNAHLPSCDFQKAFIQAVALFSCGLPPEISVESSAELPGVRIRGSSNKLEHLILNLALNARDAILPSSGTIRISAALVDTYPPDCALKITATGQLVELTVQDTGCGIAQGDLTRIFEPYYTTKAPGRGTGLGLSSVWGILRELGGTIRVTSTPGAGSQFSLYLPVSTSADQESIPAPEIVPDLMGNGQRLLLLERDPDLANLLVWLLLRHGYKVLHSSSLLQAQEILNAPDHNIDAVVSEELSESTLALEVLALIASRNTPALRMASRSAAPTTSPPPFKLTIAKPFTPEQFLQAVSQLLAPLTLPSTRNP